VDDLDRPNLLIAQTIDIHNYPIVNKVADLLDIETVSNIASWYM
jgi:hypothetical protein